jgi:hypothetical protein
LKGEQLTCGLKNAENELKEEPHDDSQENFSDHHHGVTETRFGQNAVRVSDKRGENDRREKRQ